MTDKNSKKKKSSDPDMPALVASFMELSFAETDSHLLAKNFLSVEDLPDLSDKDLVDMELSMKARLIIRRLSPRVSNKPKSIKVPSHMPFFRGTGPSHYSSPEEFLTRFEAKMEASEVSDVSWSSVLTSQLSLLTDLRYWKANGASLQWRKAKALFMVHFGSTNTRQMRIDQIHTFSQTAGETVQSYIDRFTDLVQLAELDADSIMLVAPFRRGFSSQKLRVALDSREAYDNPYQTITEIAQAALFVESQLARQENDMKPMQKTPKVSPPPSSSSSASAVKYHCSVHGECGHETKDCRMAKKEQPLLKKSPPEMKSVKFPPSKPEEKVPKTLYCFKCKQSGHWANECPNLKVAAAVSADSDLDTIYDVLDALTIKARTISSTDSPTSVSEIRCPMHVNDHPVLALVDTGCSHSIVSTNVVDKQELKWQPVKGVITLANGTTVSRIGKTIKTLLRCNGVIHECSLEIMKTPYDVILGMDLLSKCGIGVTGVPVSHADLTNPTQLSDTNMLSSTQPCILPHPERDAVCDGIQAELEYNASIDDSSYCTHPASVISLKLPAGTKPIFRRQYPVPERLRPVVSTQVEKWLNQGVLVPAKPGVQWNFPLTVAPKKDLTGAKVDHRVCIDPTALNDILPDFNYPIPRIEDLLSKVQGFQIASSLDLQQGYCQDLNDEATKDILTITWKEKRYSFARGIFGVKTLTSHFQQQMTVILHECLEFVIIYVDDVIVFSASVEDHIIHLNQVIRSLNNVNLRLRLEKCEIGMQKLLILGHVVTGHSISPDPFKLSTLLTLPAPRTGKQLESFLGFTNYLRSFVPLYAQIAAPLEKHRKVKELGPVWSVECDISFNKLKEVLSCAPVLMPADPDKPLLVATDASLYAVGAVLYQETSQGLQYVSFASKSLSPAQINYSATKRELLAIVFALSKFRHWLYGARFTLFTDHSALIFLLDGKHENRMLNAWADILLEFDFSIVHRPGIANVLPDALSRVYQAQGDVSSDILLSPDCSKSIVVCSTEMNIHVSNPAETLQSFISERLDKIAIEQPKREPLLNSLHESTHYGPDSLFRKLWLSGYYWKGMLADCQATTKACKACMQYTIIRRGYHPLQPVTCTFPWKHLALDLFTLNMTSLSGMNYVLVITCICTRFTVLRALSDKTAESTARALFDVFMMLGIPAIIQSDNGREFTNQVCTVLATHFTMDWRLSTPYHPAGNGAAESHVKLSKGLLKKLIINDRENWDTYLPIAQFAVNNRISSRHGSTPFSLLMARTANDIPGSNAAELFDEAGQPFPSMTKNQIMERNATHLTIVLDAISEKTNAKNAKTAQYFNANNKITAFPDNSLVMVRDTRGMKTVFEGPYKVLKCSKGGSYRLVDQDGALYAGKVSPDLLKLVALPPIAESESPPVIGKILSERGTLRRKQYLVRWENYPILPDEWLDDSAVTGCPELALYLQNKRG